MPLLNLLHGYALLLPVYMLAACQSHESGSTTGEPLLVMAASSLSGVMPVLVQGFEARTGEPVDVAYGATGSLVAQIENGAPADVLFAADAPSMERLIRSGAIRPSSVSTYALGRLVVVWREQARKPASLRELAGPIYEVIAIANPEIAPYGAAAREALVRAGIWDPVEGRMVRGESVAQVYQLVLSGNADIGIVARSIVDTARSEFIQVERSLHAPIPQLVGILDRSTNPTAAEFLEYVLSAEGQAVLEEHGLEAAGDS